MSLAAGEKLGPYEILLPLGVWLMECGRVSYRREIEQGGSSAAALQSLWQRYII